jgi:tetratricopeptide (TPR) repeat protein
MLTLIPADFVCPSDRHGAINPMVFATLHTLTSPIQFSFRPRYRPLLAGAITTVMVALNALPSLAADPFRPNDPHDISDATEEAFEAFFYEGDYVAAEALVEQAVTTDPDEPMNHAMSAAIGYLNNDLTELANRAQLTQDKADDLMESDPLRGHLYKAVGIFLEGAHVLQTQGIARGTPTALRMLQQVFSELNAAEKIDPNDPELSLLKGFMDLLLAVNLPFANPDQAIARLENGYPTYLSQRGIAIGLRDLGRYDEALTAIEKAIEAAPENPELLYLKAQILYLNDEKAASLEFYEAALAYVEQLPSTTAAELKFEACLAEGLDGSTCAEESGINDV